MRYFHSVLAEIQEKYQLDIMSFRVVDVPKVLDREDWDKLKKAMKYPNGIRRVVK